ncbi:MAG: acetyl-CoA carboxylase biotin carboxyl carrier protein [Bacteroidota bacterium]
MDLNEIQSLIKFVSKSGASEVELETKDFKIVIKTGGRKKGGVELETATTVIQQPVPIAQAIPAVPAPPPPPAPAPAPAAEPAAPAAPDAASEANNYITIKSPMIGTFYRASNPETPPFASVGDEISTGKVICIIEAMKLFNEIESEVSGRIVKVLVEDSTPVEYDQPLFLVDPN